MPFSVGTYVRVNGSDYEVTSQVDDSHYMVFDMLTSTQKMVSANDMAQPTSLTWLDDTMKMLVIREYSHAPFPDLKPELEPELELDLEH
tara:strand:- start:591 stop:857 length:267 start_codon:yes stop_codon:yes gene_type:complete